MKNTTLISLILFLFSLASSAAQVQRPALESVYDLMKKGNSAVTSLKSIDSPQGNAPSSLAIAKSAGSVPGYPDGVYLLQIKPHDSLYPGRYNLEDLAVLKNKQAFIHIQIVGRVGEGSHFWLPAMDTAVEGTEIAGSSVHLACGSNAISRAKNNTYFFLSGQNKFAKPVRIETRLRNPVYATNPQSFIGTDHGQPINISRLFFSDPLEQFFVEHTRGLLEIPSNKSALTSKNIIETDVHNRPARKHQIKQILEYSIANKNGVKYMTFAAATGSGKTNTMLRLAELIRPKKVLIVTPRENLISQITKESRHYYPHLKITGSNESSKNIATFLKNSIDNNDIVVTTLQGFQQENIHKDNDLLSKIDTIIFDEAHHLLSQQRKHMNDYLKSHNNNRLKILYFTATPDLLHEHGKSGLQSVYQLSGEKDPNYHITPFAIRNAIDAKANTPFQIINVVDLPSIEVVTNGQNGEYNETKMCQTLKDRNDHHSVVFDIYKSTKKILAGIEENLFGKFSMAFCTGIEHAEKLAAYLNEHSRHNLSEEDNKVLERLRLAYENKVKTHPETKDKSDEFLRKYPFVFADAVHAGNQQYPLKDAAERLLRNKLGGSLFLAGASKLTEGYDNPLIEIVFNLNPVRQSNIRLLQRIGRALRIDPANPSKIALLFEFIYDQNQLLTSHVLNTMSYGISDNELSITIDSHVPGTADYKISLQPFSAMNPKKTGKKRKLIQENDPDEPHNKRPKKGDAQSNLKRELERLIRELQHKVPIADLFDGGTDLMEVDVAPTHSSASSSSSSSSSTTTTRVHRRDGDSPEELAVGNSVKETMLDELLEEAKALFEQVKDSFATSALDQRIVAIGSRLSDIAQQRNPRIEPLQRETLAPKAKVSNLLEKAMYRFYTREHHLAAPLFESVLAENHNQSADTYARAGDVYSTLKNWQRAAQLYDMALVTDPNLPADVYVNAGYAHLNLGDHQRAGLLLDIALAKDTNLPADIYAKARTAHLNSRDYNKAAPLYDIALAQDTNLPAGSYLNAAGNAYLLSGDYNKAAPFYDMGLPQDTNLPAVVYADGGYLNLLSGDNQRAAQLYDMALSKDLNLAADIYTNAGKAHYRLGNWQRAAQLYDMALVKDPDQGAVAYVDAGKAHFMAQSGRATESFAKALEKDKTLQAEISAFIQRAY